MRPLHRFVVAGALCALAMPGAADAAPARDGLLVLSGRGGYSADVTFTRAFGIAPMLEAVNDSPGGWSWHGCGDLRGFYLRPLGRNPMQGTGAVDLAALRFGHATDVGLPDEPLDRTPIPLGSTMLGGDRGQQWQPEKVVTLPAGRYRAYLLGRNGCEVRVPLRGYGATVRRSVSRAAAQQAGVADATTVPLPAAPSVRGGSASFPLSVRPSTFAVVVVHQVTWTQTSGLTGATVHETCVTDAPYPVCPGLMGQPVPGTSMPPPGNRYHHTTFADPMSGPAGAAVTSDASEVGTWYPPGTLATGEQRAVGVIVGAPVTWAQVAMFALDLS